MRQQGSAKCDHIAEMLGVKLPEQDRLGEMIVGHRDVAIGLVIERVEVEVLEGCKPGCNARGFSLAKTGRSS